jgi:hypothetical protein
MVIRQGSLWIVDKGHRTAARRRCHANAAMRPRPKLVSTKTGRELLMDQPQEPQPAGDQQDNQQGGQTISPPCGRSTVAGVAFVPMWHVASGWRRLGSL